MTRPDAIVVPPRRPIIEGARIGGLPMSERTVLAPACSAQDVDGIVV